MASSLSSGVGYLLESFWFICLKIAQYLVVNFVVFRGVELQAFYSAETSSAGWGWRTGAMELKEKKVNIKQDTETFILSKGGNWGTQGLRDQKHRLKKRHCFYCVF